MNNQQNTTKRVFFLGAGFSKAIDHNYPILGDLSQNIKQLTLNTPKYDLQTRLEIIISKLKDIDQQTQEEQINVETLMTFLSARLPSKTEEEHNIDQALYIALIQTLVEYFPNVLTLLQDDCSDSYWSPNNALQSLQEESYKPLIEIVRINSPLLSPNASCDTNLNTSLLMNFCRYLRKTLCNTVITLNYDVLFEKLYVKSGENDNSGFYIDQAYQALYPVGLTHIDRDVPKFRFETDKGTMVYPTQSTKLLKLHGSVNWYYREEAQGDIHYYYPNFRNKGLQSQTDETNEMNALTFTYNPFIIPPVLDKTRFYHNTTLSALWQDAARRLNEANEVYFIGFSLPLTDLSVKFLLQSCIQDEAKITIINYSQDSKDIEDIKKRYQEVFPRHVKQEKLCTEYCSNSDDKILFNFLKGFLEENYYPAPQT